MSAFIIHPHCRFCRSELTIEIPEDPRMAKLISELASKACCNRCADYHRDQTDRADTLQRMALSLVYAQSKEADVIRAGIRTICARVISKAEDFFLISGLSSSAGDFAQLIFDQPAYARDHVRKFMRKAEVLARQSHQAKSEPEPEYAY